MSALFAGEIVHDDPLDARNPDAMAGHVGVVLEIEGVATVMAAFRHGEVGALLDRLEGSLEGLPAPGGLRVVRDLHGMRSDPAVHRDMARQAEAMVRELDGAEPTEAVRHGIGVIGLWMALNHVTRGSGNREVLETLVERFDTACVSLHSDLEHPWQVAVGVEPLAGLGRMSPADGPRRRGRRMGSRPRPG